MEGLTSRAQATRETASKMADLEEVSRVIKYREAGGEISFHVAEGEAISANTIESVTPHGWEVTMVATPGSFTNVFLSKE